MNKYEFLHNAMFLFMHRCGSGRKVVYVFLFFKNLSLKIGRKKLKTFQKNFVVTG